MYNMNYRIERPLSILDILFRWLHFPSVVVYAHTEQWETKRKATPLIRQTLGVTSEQFYKEHKRKLHLNVNVTSTNE